MSYISNHPKRVLTGLTTVLVAAGVAVGSGASFTSASANPSNTFTAGTLTQTNSKDNAVILSADKMKPGDVNTGKVTITNTGNLASNFRLTETEDTNGFVTKSNLSVKIADETGKVISDAPLAAIADGGIDLGTFAADGGAHTYTFTVTFAASSTNAEQGKTAVATYRWAATQEAPRVRDFDSGATSPTP